MNRSLLFEQIAAMHVTDFFAEQKCRGFVPTNITELIKNRSKIEIMIALGCDEKYRNGSASDFEFFAEWERILPLCAGNGEETIYREELRLVGLSLPSSVQTREEVCRRWQMANDGLQQLSHFKKAEKATTFDWVQFVSEFVISCKGKSRKLSELAEEARKTVGALKSKELHVIFPLFEMEYQRTDPYHAEGALEKMVCDKKLYSEELFLVSAQLLILLLKAKTETKITLHLYAEPSSETPRLLITYLKERELFAGDAFVGAFVDQNFDVLHALAGCSDERVHVRPELLLRHKDCTEALSAQLKKLFAAYPMGGITFGGALTDSFCPELLHGIFREALADCLADLCREEAQAIVLARKMLKNDRS